jgi:hypothetical protein
MRSSKKILILFLAILTLALAGISGYVAYRISQEDAIDDGSANAPTCGYCANPGTGSGDCRDPVTGAARADDCSEAAKGICGGVCCCTGWNPGTGDDDSGDDDGTCTPGEVVCRKDHPSVCAGLQVEHTTVGGICASDGKTVYNCERRDACAPQVGGSCEGKTRLSCGESNHGAFVGCSGKQNCFCYKAGLGYGDGTGNPGACGDVPVGTTFDSSYTFTCYDDYLNDSCGASPDDETPLACWGTGCETGGRTCGSGMVCQNDRCVNSQCPNDSDCQCDTGGGNPTLYYCNAPNSCAATVSFKTPAECQAARGKPCYTTNDACLATAPTYCPAQNPTLYYCRNSNSCVATTDYANGQECREDPELGVQCYLTEAQCEEPANLARWCPPENPRLYYCRTSLACSSTTDYPTAAECRTAKGVPCYTSNDSCLGTAPTYCPVYCGDGLCNAAGEKCETTTRNNTIERVCTAADTAAGRAPTGALVDCRGVEYNLPTTEAGWRCKYCGDGIVQRGEQCDYAATPNTCNTDCTLKEAENKCLTLTASATTVSDGSPITFVLRYQHRSTTNPFPNIKLRVGDPAVGRDRLATSSELVSATHAYNATNSVHIYRFQWEAVSTAGVVVPDGTYPVRILSDGSSTVIDTVACQSALTVSADEPEAPLFVINKASTSVCDTNGDEVITYTITLTNIGPVQGVIDFVEDTFDENLLTLGITPTEITPDLNAENGDPEDEYIEGTNRIRWTGSTADRTFTAGQSKTYSYQIRIPLDQLVEFADAGVFNEAEVQYDTPNSTDNTASFDLRTMLTCSVPVIPDTGIANDLGLFMIVGLLLIFGGVVTYRYRLSQNFTENIFLKGLDRIGGYIPQGSFERNIEEKLEKKANGGKKRRRK